MFSITTTSPKQVKTMSSREIAELTGKNHAHVCRDIRTMLEQLGLGESTFGSSYVTAQNKQAAEYLLPRRECEILVTGYDVNRRAAVIDRWMELEQKNNTPALPNRKELALMVLKAEEEIECLEHKVDTLESQIERRGCQKGYMLISDARRVYGRGLSEDMFRLIIKRSGIPQAPIYVDGLFGSTQSIEVEEKSVNDLVEWFYNTMYPVSKTLYQHPDLENKRFRA